MEKRWTVEELAEHFGCCVRTIRNWIESRDLVSVKIGAFVWVLDSDLQEFIRRHRREKRRRSRHGDEFEEDITDDEVHAFYSRRRAANSAAD